MGMDAAADPIAIEITRRLVSLYRPTRVYLFGSKARGEFGEDSDYDFLVVVPDDTTKQDRETNEVFRLLRDIDAPIDVLVWRQADFDTRLRVVASLPATVSREGKLLYAA